MSRTWYMHTLDGRPATYVPGTQICFVDGRHKARLVPSLAQIRRERRASGEWRERRGYRDDGDYDYVLVEVDLEEESRG